MNRGPVGGGAAKNHVDTVLGAWGPDAPEWVITLAQQCNRASQTAIGRELSYSGAVISAVLAKSYRGDVARIEDMVRGRFMAAKVDCPVLGEIGRDVCLGWQKKPYAVTSSHRVQMYRACRDGCPHSTISDHSGGVNAQ